MPSAIARTPLTSAYSGTFIDLNEAIIQDLAEWGADYIEHVIEVLMPDGRAFGQVKLSPNEELMLYLNIRGDAIQWRQWIERKVMEVRQLLSDAGLTEDLLVGAHVYDIVIPMALSYSSRMEAYLNRVSERYDPSHEEADYLMLPEGPDDAAAVQPEI